MANSFWNGRRKEECALIDALLPDNGEVEYAVSNHALELYRLFNNAYHDVYNNGGCNWEHRGPGLRIVCDVYGLKGSLKQFLTEITRNGFSPELEHIGDVVLDAALKEQCL